MWKRNSGSWQERLKRSSVLTPSPTLVPDCDSVNQPYAPPLQFLNSTFINSEPLVEFPTLQEAATAGSSPIKPSSAHWVTFSGVDGRHVLPLRAHLDAAIGHTIAHYVPARSGEVGKFLYICFEKAPDAYWMVRKGRIRLHYEEGTQVEPTGLLERDGCTSLCYSFEIDAFWCTDEIFLEKYDRRTTDCRGQLPCSGEERKRTNEISSAGPSSPRAEEVSDSTGSSDSSSEPKTAGHSTSQLSQSSTSFFDQGRPGFYDGNVLSITSLVYTPPIDNVFSQLLRLLVLLTWSFFRVLSLVMSGGERRSTSINPKTLFYPFKLDTSSLSSSPIQYLTHWLAFHIPFAPSVSEVNLCIWSVWHRRSPQAQHSLIQRLKEIHKSSQYFSPSRLGDNFYEPSTGLSHLPSIFIWKSSYTITRYSFLISLFYVLLVVWALF